MVEVFILAESQNIDHEYCEEESSLPEGSVDHVEHFIVEHVDFLHALKIILSLRSVGKGPHSEVVHVSQHLPLMLEGCLSSIREKFIFELSLLVISREAIEVSEIGLGTLENLQLVHDFLSNNLL